MLVQCVACREWVEEPGGLEKKCPRCGQTCEVPRWEEGSGLILWGWLFWVAAILVGGIVVAMPAGHEGVANFSRMMEKLYGILLAAVLGVVGSILYTGGKIVKALKK